MTRVKVTHYSRPNRSPNDSTRRSKVWDHSPRKLPLLPVIRFGDGPGRVGILCYRASKIEELIAEQEHLSDARRKNSGRKITKTHLFPHRSMRNKWKNRIRGVESFSVVRGGLAITAGRRSIGPRANRKST